MNEAQFHDALRAIVRGEVNDVVAEELWIRRQLKRSAEYVELLRRIARTPEGQSVAGVHAYRSNKTLRLG